MTRAEATARVIEAARKRRDLEHVNVVFPREYEAWDKEWTAATIEFDDALALYDSTPDSEGGWRPISTIPDEIKFDEVVLLFKPDEPRSGDSRSWAIGTLASRAGRQCMGRMSFIT